MNKQGEQGITLDNILANDALFRDHFCSEATIERLAGIRPKILRAVIKQLQKTAKCVAFTTPRYWTPSGSAQAVVVCGSLGVDGKMRGKRFGLCTDLSSTKASPKANLYIWTERALVEDAIAQGACSRSFLNDWVPWREVDDPGRYLRLSDPVASPDTGVQAFVALQGGDDLISMLRSASGHQQVSSRLLQEIQTVLEMFGHAYDAITPMVVDRYRYSDVYDVESDGDIKPYGKLRNHIQINAQKASSSGDARHAVASFVRQGNCRKVKIAHFGAQTLFDVTEVKPPAEKLPFLNLSFSSRIGSEGSFKGGGLYGIFYDNGLSSSPSLIYVGLFRNGKKGSGAVFGGNILRARWEKHIATCSVRSSNIGISSRTARSLLALQEDHPLRAMGNPDVAKLIVRDRGCNAGENRVLFAKKNWGALGEADGEDILSRFTFSYVRLTAGLDHESDDDIRHVIGRAEKKLKSDFAPFCNAETGIGKHRWGISFHEFEEAAKRALLEIRQ